jgi:hypothetical protein
MAVLTQSHNTRQVRWTKFNHDRVRVSIDDLCVVFMAVIDTILCFYFLKF